MCNKLTANTTNVTSICLVNPDRHRLTEDGVFIDVLPSTMTDERPIIGRWYDASGNDTYIPLYTRFQPQNRSGNNYSKAIDIRRFEPYKFKFTEQIDIKKILEGKQEKICFVGASHSRMLIRHSKALEGILNNGTSKTKWTANVNGFNSSTGEELQFDFVEAKFASNLTEDKIHEIIDRNCTKIIVGTGQWDAGWPGNVLTSFTEYETTLRTVMSLMMRLLPPNMHVFYCSVQ
jgi:hypothetical protein